MYQIQNLLVTLLKKNYSKVFSILDSCRVTDNSPINFVTMEPPGKFNINSSELKKLIKHYSKIYQKIPSPFNFAEIPKEISYFKLDVDLEGAKNQKRLYNQKQLYN